MASSSSLFASLKHPSSSPVDQKSRSRDSVYVASVPLRAAKGPPQLLMSAAYSLNLWELQHFMVIIKSQESDAVVFDFQPQYPENISVALAVLMRRQISGVVLRRKLSRLPKNRCWFVGYSNSNSVEIAGTFNETWSTDLIVGEHDCRHYTEGLVQRLTGEKKVLDLLRVNSRKELNF